MKIDAETVSTKGLALFFSVILSIAIGGTVYYLYFYVHEGGHILYSSFDSLAHGNIPVSYISRWVDYPLFKGLKIPMQTRAGEPSLNLAFGGIVLVILVSTGISWWGYKTSKNKIYLAFPFIFLFHEFLGNFLCGTDNPTGKPLYDCNPIQNWVWIFFTSFLIPITILLYPQVLRKILSFKSGRKV